MKLTKCDKVEWGEKSHELHKHKFGVCETQGPLCSKLMLKSWKIFVSILVVSNLDTFSLTIPVKFI